MRVTDTRWVVIGQQIAQARVSKGMFVQDLAAQLGVSRATVNNDERGIRVRSSRLKAYCDIFGWSLPKVLAFLEDEDGAQEAAVRGARDDYIAFVRANELLLRGQTERATLLGAAAEVVAARYGVAVESFTEKVHRPRGWREEPE